MEPQTEKQAEAAIIRTWSGIEWQCAVNRLLIEAGHRGYHGPTEGLLSRPEMDRAFAAWTESVTLLINERPARSEPQADGDVAPEGVDLRLVTEEAA